MKKELTINDSELKKYNDSHKSAIHNYCHDKNRIETLKGNNIQIFLLLLPIGTFSGIIFEKLLPSLPSLIVKNPLMVLLFTPILLMLLFLMYHLLSHIGENKEDINILKVSIANNSQEIESIDLDKLDKYLLINFNNLLDYASINPKNDKVFKKINQELKNYLKNNSKADKEDFFYYWQEYTNKLSRLETQIYR